MTGTALEHNALVYDGVAEYLATVVPFLRDGLEAGDAVFAVLPGPRLEALRDVLGRAGGQITYVEAGTFYRHPVRALQDYDRLVRAHAPRRVRVAGERNWSADARWETAEWIRYETLVNTVFARSGARVVCAYDRNAVDAGIVEEARRAHPWMIVGGDRRANGGYEDSPVPGPDRDRPAPPADACHLPFGSAFELYQVRRFVTARASAHGLDAGRLAALETAVTEVATNALKHGAAPMGVRVWSQGGEFVCEVGDHGRWRAGAPAGFAPPGSALDSGFGLWTVRLLVDAVRLYADRDGTFVRLVMRG
ncbi:sensor histidine kinase [Thermomonospora cellulosilytica]|uniref:Anti-sigma regulatory factor (Ser/Thr protein kinase) n=1 Tax=Thermomonospora cellulosilytica TaxID=1411118 RepID=A0A7W3N4Y3_9ACTN|nr:sensor histidine kinase [Thermomonospora cellulosilytica]MBA9007644.1 anti-sigma regulatory factor (Ser/Thr protein kinase) [Thermomonospora cellulosilytica]